MQQPTRATKRRCIWCRGGAARPLQVGALQLAVCRAKSGPPKECNPPCRWRTCHTGGWSYGHDIPCCKCPNAGVRRLAGSAEVAAPWRDGAVDVLGVACGPGSAASPLCESEEGLMDALHNKVSGHCTSTVEDGGGCSSGGRTEQMWDCSALESGPAERTRRADPQPLAVPTAAHRAHWHPCSLPACLPSLWA